MRLNVYSLHFSRRYFGVELLRCTCEAKAYDYSRCIYLYRVYQMCRP